MHDNAAIALATIMLAAGCSNDEAQASMDQGGAGGGLAAAGPGGFGGTSTAGAQGVGGGGVGGESTGGGAGPGEPVIVTAGYGGRRMRSLDLGVTWIDGIRDDPNGGDDMNLLRAITYAEGLFVAVGWRIHTSTDGSTWEEHTLSGQQWCGGLAYGNGRFVCTGGCGNTYRSTDGLTWEAAGNATTGGCMHMRSLAFGNGVFVAAGDNGLVNTTSDGMDWNASASDEQVNNVIFRDGEFIASGVGGFHKTSPDGVTWTQQVGDANMESFGHGVYVRGRWKGIIERSTDAVAWDRVLDDGGNHLSAFAFGFIAP